jgi:hypothetical protein
MVKFCWLAQEEIPVLHYYFVGMVENGANNCENNILKYNENGDSPP